VRVLLGQEILDEAAYAIGLLESLGHEEVGHEGFGADPRLSLLKPGPRAVATPRGLCRGRIERSERENVPQRVDFIRFLHGAFLMWQSMARLPEPFFPRGPDQSLPQHAGSLRGVAGKGRHSRQEQSRGRVVAVTVLGWPGCCLEDRLLMPGEDFPRQDSAQL